MSTSVNISKGDLYALKLSFVQAISIIDKKLQEESADVSTSSRPKGLRKKVINQKMDDVLERRKKQLIRK